MAHDEFNNAGMGTKKTRMGKAVVSERAELRKRKSRAIMWRRAFRTAMKRTDNQTASIAEADALLKAWDERFGDAK